MARGSIAAFLISNGRILIAIAVAEGIAGPAQALMSTHALHQALWTALFAAQPLSPLQVTAVLLGLMGVTTIAAVDHLVKKCRGLNDDDEKLDKVKPSVEPPQTAGEEAQPTQIE